MPVLSLISSLQGNMLPTFFLSLTFVMLRNAPNEPDYSENATHYNNLNITKKKQVKISFIPYFPKQFITLDILLNFAYQF